MENLVKHQPKPETRVKKMILWHVKNDPFVTSTALKHSSNVDIREPPHWPASKWRNIPDQFKQKYFFLTL